MATKKSGGAGKKDDNTITMVDRLLPIAHLLFSDGRLIGFWPIIGLTGWMFYLIQPDKRGDFVIQMAQLPLVWVVTLVLIGFVIYMAVVNNYKYMSQQAEELKRVTEERTEVQRIALGPGKINSSQNKKSD